MKKVYVMIANGTEEAECIIVYDLFKRSGMDVTLVSVEESSTIISSHKLSINADVCIETLSMVDADIIFLPGRMPGSKRLSSCDKLVSAIKSTINKGGRIAAICAAPAVVLGQHDLLMGKNAVCYPGFESLLIGANATSSGVVTDGQFTTAMSLGYVIDLALEIIKLECNEEISEKVKKEIIYNKIV